MDDFSPQKEQKLSPKAFVQGGGGYRDGLGLGLPRPAWPSSLQHSCTYACFCDLLYCVPHAWTVLIQFGLPCCACCLGHFWIQQGTLYFDSTLG